jgi:hypothetical protein
MSECGLSHIGQKADGLQFCMECREELETPREKALKDAIAALCPRCVNNEKREHWNGDRTHKTEPVTGAGGVLLVGHFSCPANPVWRILEAEQ